MGGTIHIRNSISIHSLRMEGDRWDTKHTAVIFRFQSTPSAWRETTGATGVTSSIVISIHSLRMEGDIYCYSGFPGSGISIHSLRMEGDPSSSGRSRTGGISIHSLRMEGDSKNDT